jgi:hypothetical protein
MPWSVRTGRTIWDGLNSFGGVPDNSGGRACGREPSRGEPHVWYKCSRCSGSCHRVAIRPFRMLWHLAVQGQLGAAPVGRLGLQPGNFLRQLALPREVKHWSLRTLRERLIKFGAQVVSRSKEVTFQIGDVVVPRRLFAPILDRIGVCGSSRGRVERAGKVRRVDAVGILTATVRLEGPDPGEGRGQVPPQQGSFATPGVTWAGIPLSGVVGSPLMRLGINRKGRSIESDGSHLGIPSRRSNWPTSARARICRTRSSRPSIFI